MSHLSTVLPMKILHPIFLWIRSKQYWNLYLVFAFYGQTGYLWMVCGNQPRKWIPWVTVQPEPLFFGEKNMNWVMKAGGEENSGLSPRQRLCCPRGPWSGATPTSTPSACLSQWGWPPGQRCQAQGWAPKGTNGSSGPRSTAAKVPYKATRPLKSVRAHTRKVTAPVTPPHSPVVILPMQKKEEAIKQAGSIGGEMRERKPAQHAGRS